eukprot:13503657-Alexandrium_andersonii.AAC.1
MPSSSAGRLWSSSRVFAMAVRTFGCRAIGTTSSRQPSRSGAGYSSLRAASACRPLWPPPSRC